MDSDHRTIEITARVRVDREVWDAMTPDERAAEVHASVQDVASWEWCEIVEPASD